MPLLAAAYAVDRSKIRDGWIDYFGVAQMLDVNKKENAEVREKAVVMQNMWAFVKLKAPSRTVTIDLADNTIDLHLRFLLSDQVWKMERVVGNRVLAQPPWAVLLDYDMALRRAAAKKVNSGMSLARALAEVRADACLKQEAWLTPIAITVKLDNPGGTSSSSFPAARSSSSISSASSSS